MGQFADFQEENIAYWSNRAPGYSEVNREELEGGQRGIWKRVWTREERINNTSTPMFLIRGVKEPRTGEQGCRDRGEGD